MRKYIALAAFAAICLGAAPASAQWTGCGAGARGGIVDANATSGGPIGASAQGQLIGLELNCDYKMQAFVVGGFADYDWYLGDIKSLSPAGGIQNQLTIGARAGVLINAFNLLYAHADWVQENTSIKNYSTINGIGFGLGDEFRVPNSPLYLDLRYTHIMFDTSDTTKYPSTLKADADEFVGHIKLKFGPGAFGGHGPIFSNEEDAATAVCDPKLANCKR